MTQVHVFGGGTVFHVRPHFALAAPAYGGTARKIGELVARGLWADGLWSSSTKLHLTKMAGGDMETNADVAKRITKVLDSPETKLIFMSVALCDWEGTVGGMPSGKDHPRLKTIDGDLSMFLTPAEKIIGTIRKTRKDVFLVGFKTTAGASPDDQYFAGLNLLKTASCNLVLANDVHTRLNIVITPEQARYHETTNRQEALEGLVDMAMKRSKGTFTRSTVVPGESVKWQSDMVPASLRTVVDHCISRGAYKPFNGSTVGHFAFKVDDTRFITSKRKIDFNKLSEEGMVLVEATGDDCVTAHGFKPSVGGQSQRIIFREHPDVDCIVHFHCPLKPGSKVAVREQRPYECGSHECGKNTSDGLSEADPGIKAVMLDRHGPNIVFHRDADPSRVIDFIETNFDLAGRTDNVAVS